jgi:DNA-binding NtrC family response regulator
MTGNEDKINLLLVDDEKEFLDSTSRALSRRGFDVTTALNGDAALKILETHSFDAAVLDVKMPGIPGDQLFRNIKLRRPEMPMIILTGHGTVKQAFQTSREGIFDYLTKPCDVETLVRVVRKAVAARAEGAAPGGEAAPDGEEVRLLIVDDEWELLESLEPVLSRRNMTVAIARSSAEAIDVLASQRFDVALVDVTMPGIDGITLLSRIKQVLPFCEVILFTGKPSVDLALKGVREGAFDYMVKPQDVDTLTARIRDAFRQSRTRAEEAGQSNIDNIRERYRD